MSAQGIGFFGHYLLISLRSFEAHYVAEIYDKNEINPTFKAEIRIWLQREVDIFVDYVNAKRKCPWEQPSETRGRHVSAAINCLTRCRRKSLVTVVATIVSIAVLIAVVLVGKCLAQTP